MTKPLLHTSRLVTQFRRYLDTSNTGDFITAVSDNYSIETLANMLYRGGCETRRAAALALSMIGDLSIIDDIGRRLSDPDRGVRIVADDAFRSILIRDAAPAHYQQLLKIMHLIDGGEFAAALTPAMMLSQQAPNYAEAQHQLALAWTGLDDYSSAECAFRNCLWQCRFHYMAWLGLAECRRACGDDRGALKHLRTSLRLCPDLEIARANIRAIQRSRDADN